MGKKKPFSVDEYISSFPADTQKLLRQIRSIIRREVPDAVEVISYGIAGYKWNGTLIYFAGFKQHVSIYPAPRGHEKFRGALKKFKGGKGTVQFPLDRPIPARLIAQIVKFRRDENQLKSRSKK